MPGPVPRALQAQFIEFAHITLSPFCRAGRRGSDWCRDLPEVTLRAGAPGSRYRPGEAGRGCYPLLRREPRGRSGGRGGRRSGGCSGRGWPS